MMSPRSRSRPQVEPRPSTRRRPAAKSDTALTQRLRFESFLLELSAAFATVPVGGLAHQIENGHRPVRRFIDVDRSSLGLDPADGQIRLLYFSTPGTPAPSIDAAAGEMSWLTGQCLRGNVFRRAFPATFRRRRSAKRLGAPHLRKISAVHPDERRTGRTLDRVYLPATLHCRPPHQEIAAGG